MSLVTESIIWGGLENIPLGSLTPKEQQERRALLGVQFMEKQKYEVSNRVETSATAKHGADEQSVQCNGGSVPSNLYNTTDTESNRRTSPLVAHFDENGVHEDELCIIH